MDFSLALSNALSGIRIRRSSWASGDFVALMPELNLAAHSAEGDGPKVNERTKHWIGDKMPVRVSSYFQKYSMMDWFAGYDIEMGWTPCNEELKATDWEVME